MKRIGFLSFGHWASSPQSRTQSAADALLQAIDLAVEAERLGMDGAYFGVHHLAQQLAVTHPKLILSSIPHARGMGPQKRPLEKRTENWSR
jgi:alkanesulfonate monooxygenase SsuD/methylene tetrahydromethanopterin reductase-like flavin-dependent oxidoreductase (luciferase family)